MTGTLPFSRRSATGRPVGTPVRTRQDVEALTAEHATALVDTAIGLLPVRRDMPGGQPSYAVGIVGGLTAAQAGQVCAQISACLPDLPPLPEVP